MSRCGSRSGLGAGFALAVLLAAPVPGGAAVAGGGSARSDCWVEFEGLPGDRASVRCTDGDAACDADGVPNGECRFVITPCLNVADPQLPRCAPTTIADFRARGSRSLTASLESLARAVGEQIALQPAASSCATPVAIRLPLGGRKTFKATTGKVRTRARGDGGRTDIDGLTLRCKPSREMRRPGSQFARARVVTQPAELIEGPLARGRTGDLLLFNDRIQVIVQQAGRAMFGIGTYGGNIIDAERTRPANGEHDNFEEAAIGVNVESTANYTQVQVLNDGTNGEPAIVRATGPDDLLDFVNPSSVVEMAGFAFPPSLDDQDLPLEIQTDYVLEPGTDAVRVESTVRNLGGAPLDIFLGDFLNGSGDVEVFQPGYGFGEPLVTTPCPQDTWPACPAGTCDPCDFVAYGGLGADVPSYGWVHATNASTSFSVSGVTVPLLGNQVVLVLIGAGTPNYHLGAAGAAGDAVTVTRWFAVGDGSVASIADVRNGVRAFATGTLSGRVSAGGAPVVDADVAVIGPPIAGRSTNVVDHFRTGADGTYRGTLPAGTYSVRANRDGHPAATPDPATVTITADATSTQDFTLPEPGHLRVTVTDDTGSPGPAKVQLVGFDPSPDPLCTESVFGLINNVTSVFSGLREDGAPYGIAFIAFAGKSGDTGVLDVEPGEYQLAVSRGSRYGVFTQPVTVTAGGRTTIAASLVRVVDTPGFITADFHLHSIASPDSEVTPTDRVLTQLAEGVDFITPSEHDIRVDFQPVIDAMGVGDLIATAPSAEITTFDYGHFNSWPVTVDPAAVNGGSVDWGRAGIAPGQDFPALGSFGLTPAEIYAAAHADPRPNLIQINHVDSFFNTTGLDIDTAEGDTGPPQSHVPGAARRLDPAILNFFDGGFDALEVWNGSQSIFLGENFGDWVNLLSQGIRRTAVANSDTHEKRTNGGAVRTYVASAVTDPGQLGAQADTLAATIVAGRAVGTNGPFVTTSLLAASTGQTASLAQGQPLQVRTSDDSVELTVTVRSPGWAEFDRIEVYVNAATQRWDHDARPATRPRYRVVPTLTLNAGTDFTRTTVTVDGDVPGAVRHEATAVVPITGLTQDAWILVLVRGTPGVSKPLFPVLPYSLTPTGNTTLAELTDGNLGEGGEPALTFTNPLFVDVDGDGVWTAPGIRIAP